MTIWPPPKKEIGLRNLDTKILTSLWTRKIDRSISSKNKDEERMTIKDTWQITLKPRLSLSRSFCDGYNYCHAHHSKWWNDEKIDSVPPWYTKVLREPTVCTENLALIPKQTTSNIITKMTSSHDSHLEKYFSSEHRSQFCGRALYDPKNNSILPISRFYRPLSLIDRNIHWQTSVSDHSPAALTPLPVSQMPKCTRVNIFLRTSCRSCGRR